jgi:hypothetical protein
MSSKEALMRGSQRTALFWVPRILAILTAVFLGTFALDVFTEGYRAGDLWVALLIHLIPSLLILASLGIAWRWERLGGWLFILLGLFYIWYFWHPSRWLSYLAISGPLFLTGLMFLFNNWLIRVEETPVKEEAVGGNGN